MICHDAQQTFRDARAAWVRPATIKVAQRNRGRVSVPAQAALSGSHNKAPGFAGGYLPTEMLFGWKRGSNYLSRNVLSAIVNSPGRSSGAKCPAPGTMIFSTRLVEKARTSAS
jgi:hypothetical protein